MLKLKNKRIILYTGTVHDLTVSNSSSYNIEDISVHNSAAGSLLSWCLGITKIDSIRFKLYFERFLNPERKATPDIDIDFEADTDEQTLQFLYDKYGRERVVPVVTFGTFNQKRCLKDVAKALGYDSGMSSDVTAVTKEMPKTPVWPISLDEWFKTWPENPDCSERVKNWILNPENQPTINYTLKLQGQVRNLGKHAAGIVITPGPVWELMPVNICSGQIVSGYQESGVIKDISSLGGLKLDRLKLETLNVIKESLALIKEKHGIEKYEKVKNDIDFINLENPDLFVELRMGNNQGIFQFESEGMTALIKGIQVEKFDELVAANALYRPATMAIGAHEEYIKNKFNPDERKYAHPILAPLLEETNGVLIYQEQLMFIANKIGGMTLGEGDNLRKAMDSGKEIIGKKLAGRTLTEKEEENKSYKSYKELWKKFVQGAKDKGLSDKDVAAIESWLIAYLGYSFNMSHAVSYSYIAMQTLYLKHYYPIEFYCSLLNHPKTSSDKEKDARWFSAALMATMSRGIEIIPPNRKSNWAWTIIDDKKIAMGYASIKGLGKIAFNELKANNIENMTRDEFYSKKWKKFNKRHFEGCLKAGLFDDWSPSREQLNDWRNIKVKDPKQYDMFTGEVGFSNIANLKKFPPTSEEQRYKQFIEICNLDLNLLKKITTLKNLFYEETGRHIESITNFEDPKKFYYFSIVKVEERTSQEKGTKYYSLTIGDGATNKRVNMWSNMYTKLKPIINEGSFYITQFRREKGFLAFNATAPFKCVMQ